MGLDISPVRMEQKRKENGRMENGINGNSCFFNFIQLICAKNIFALLLLFFIYLGSTKNDRYATEMPSLASGSLYKIILESLEKKRALSCSFYHKIYVMFMLTFMYYFFICKQTLV